PFNTYGPRQSARAIIPSVLAQVLKGNREIKVGNMLPKRDLTFVTDSARAFLLAATVKDIEGETIHFGQGSAIAMDELTELCLKVTGSCARIVSVEDRLRPENSEVELLLCDSTKAKRILDWRPKIPLEEGVRQTAEYLARHLDDYRACDYVV